MKSVIVRKHGINAIWGDRSKVEMEEEVTVEKLVANQVFTRGGV